MYFYNRKNIKLKELKSYSDQELYILVGDKVKDSELAFSLLYERLSPKVWAYCLRLTDNETIAKDILQETFIEFYNIIDSETIIMNIQTKLFNISRKIYLRILRKRQDLISFEEDIHSFVMPEDNDELLDLIKKALKKLPDDYKEIFILREYNCLSYQEIQEITGESLSNVKVRIHRARAKIRTILKNHIKEMKELNVDINDF